MTLSLDPYHTNQMFRIPAELIHQGQQCTTRLMGRHARPTRWFSAVHEKQEANRAETTSHGELRRLPSEDGKDQQKGEGVEKGKHQRRNDPWVPRDWDTRIPHKECEGLKRSIFKIFISN
ncbi:hypothetical protein AVEN_67254-1 [Araneus ventricosus]|uniref:Uncharacterized protein n=1 Tax=Araneus ventricosus TaxID=182803 RepID=A0A4Y2Q551_ARAVE|nr:hypothetical protein AVEN_67254-1 [Araneus ventricosus]